jgi:hypothetical protein
MKKLAAASAAPILATELQQIAKLAVGEASILEDLFDQPSRQLSWMNWHDDEPVRDRVEHGSVATSLSDEFEASFLQRPNQLLGADSRQAWRHIYMMTGTRTVIPSDTGSSD